MADDPNNPDLSAMQTALAALPSQQPDLSSLSAIAAPPNTPTPMVQGGRPALTPAQQNAPPQPGLPGIMGLISGMINPSRGTPAGQLAPSRLDHFENFLGNFMTSLAAGFSTPPGPGYTARSAAAAATAPYQQAVRNWQLGQESNVRQAQIESEQAQTNLRNVQARLTPVRLPNGEMAYFPPKEAERLLQNRETVAGREQVAHITADNRTALMEFKTMLDAGKVAFTKPVPDGRGGSTWAAFNRQGIMVRTLDGTIGPAWLQPTERSGVIVRQRQDGGYDYIPVSSTTRRLLGPGNGPPLLTPTVLPPPGTPQSNSVIPRPSATPQQNPQGQGTQQTIPIPSSRGGRGGARPVLDSSGKPLQGPLAVQSGYAYDPQNNQTVLTTRGDFQNQGYKNFRPVSQPEIEKDRQIINRLNDVETKLNRYGDALNDPGLTDDDRSAIGKVIRSDKLKLGMFGLEVPVDDLNQWMRQNRIGQMSPAGQKALAAWYNSRESMSGYQRILSGSNRGSDKVMELNIDTLPKPMDPTDYANEAIGQFRENIPIMRAGLPVLPGVPTGPRNAPTSTPKGNQPGRNQGAGNQGGNQNRGQNVAPEGTIIDIGGGRRQIKQGGQWVDLK